MHRNMFASMDPGGWLVIGRTNAGEGEQKLGEREERELKNKISIPAGRITRSVNGWHEDVD